MALPVSSSLAFHFGRCFSCGFSDFILCPTHQCAICLASTPKSEPFTYFSASAMQPVKQTSCPVRPVYAQEMPFVPAKDSSTAPAHTKKPETSSPRLAGWTVRSLDPLKKSPLGPPDVDSLKKKQKSLMEWTTTPASLPHPPLSFKPWIDTSTWSAHGESTPSPQESLTSSACSPNTTTSSTPSTLG